MILYFIIYLHLVFIQNSKLQLTDNKHYVMKCYLPSEYDVFLIYIVAGGVIALYLFKFFLKCLFSLKEGVKKNKIY